MPAAARRARRARRPRADPRRRRRHRHRTGGPARAVRSARVSRDPRVRRPPGRRRSPPGRAPAACGARRAVRPPRAAAPVRAAQALLRAGAARWRSPGRCWPRAGWRSTGSSVTGLGRLSDAQVRAAVDVAPGTPLARVDTGAVAAGRARRCRRSPASTSRGPGPGRCASSCASAVAVAGFRGDGRSRCSTRRRCRFATVPALPRGRRPRSGHALRRGDPAVAGRAARAPADLPPTLRARVAGRARRRARSSVVLLLRRRPAGRVGRARRHRHQGRRRARAAARAG